MMIWAACCAGFFGFMRCGEFTVAAEAAYDCSHHLSMSNVSVDSHEEPTMVVLQLWFTKTDQFRRGTNIYLGRTSSTICP